MKSNRGQALVEFIFIIPIFIFILFVIIDIGNIIYQKYQLENDIDIVADMYSLKRNDDINSYLSDKGATIKYEKDEKYVDITLEKEVNVNTIILNNIIGKKYKISVNKTIIDGDYSE